MKAVVVGAVVLFVGFWMVESPASLAEFAEEGSVWIWEMVTVVFESVIDFLSALFD